MPQLTLQPVPVCGSDKTSYSGGYTSFFLELGPQSILARIALQQMLAHLQQVTGTIWHLHGVERQRIPCCSIHWRTWHVHGWTVALVASSPGNTSTRGNAGFVLPVRLIDQ